MILRGVAKNPVSRENIVYETHPYPGKPRPWNDYFGFLSTSYPLFVGEWGFEPESEDENLRATTDNYGRPLLTYMDEKGMSWTAQCWSPFWAPRMLHSWAYEPTEFGQLVKNTLTSTAAATVPPTAEVPGFTLGLLIGAERRQLLP